jgi:hypothetical protein
LNATTPFPGNPPNLMGYTYEDYFKNYMDRLKNLSGEVMLRPSSMDK